MQTPNNLSGITLKTGEKVEGSEQLVGGGPSTLLEKRHPNEPSENAILLSMGTPVPCLLDGKVRTIVIKPFKFADLENVLDAVTPIYSKMENLAKSREEVFNLVKDSKKLLTFVKEHKPAILKFMVAFNKDLTADFVNELDIGTVAELLLAIVTVNVDFFIQEASVKLINSLQKLAVEVIPKLGSIRKE
ncbi:MAG: hypothetical protein RR280_01410 [Bacteroidaceae bacterium]